MDCYLAQVVEIKGNKGWIPTIDVADGRCITGIIYSHDNKESAEIEMKEMIKKFNVNLVKDMRVTSAALTKKERVYIHSCKIKGVKYKDKLLRSRIENRHLTKEEMQNE